MQDNTTALKAFLKKVFGLVSIDFITSELYIYKYTVFVRTACRMLNFVKVPRTYMIIFAITKRDFST
jgi:hypothetical protein